ncbi:molybdopterin-dependent oxidoreductase [Ramlibacter sp. RBP-2]|uniref:Molybdopterin-dependent oxidoreductase n=1 Tax=Ramlibacter lithotrophicus TaxID=2606681 RepID=A0A7X6DDX3_9BURK|nr:molybdopterin-dependent oxidoreductase [Ramlibacter lithotrophicus]
MKETRSTCPYCGVGCGVVIESDGDRITGVRGDPRHPANFGRLCTKGSTLHLTATAPVTRHARLLQPMRREHRGGRPQPVTWDQALGFASDTFARIIGEHGPDAVGFYVSGQLLTEDYYVFNKLAKGLVGTNNIDSNSRLCMSSAVAAYQLALGADAPPACYDDVDQADCIFIAGSNTAWAHPVLFRRIEDARTANPRLKIVCCDPRRTETAAAADLHLALLPGTDVMLFNGMLHVMLWEGWVRQDFIAAHTTGFDELKAQVRDCTPDVVAQVCGISKEDLLTAARLFATSAATLSLYCQGLNQSTSGTAKNAALINLHLASGQIGKPGAGPFSLTGQPNAMGGREVGGMASLLSAHRNLANAEHRAEVAALWGLPGVPDRPGKTAVEMFQAAADGEIKALWIACTNPAQSMPGQATVRRALERAELVVVQEAFATTATCDRADLLLPATTWGEKTGTVTNSERRISRVRPAVPAPGQARHDWAVAVDFARRLEARLRPGRPTLFPYDADAGCAGAESIWNEHRASTRGRDLDITGMSYALIESAPQQWPMPAAASAGTARLYQDGRFATGDGRARFVAVAWQPVAEPREARYPFSLTTGRLRDQWHGMSRSGTVGRLFGHVPEPAVEMHPQDLARRGLREGDLVHVTSRRGSIVLPVQASDEVAPSQAFLAMHWGPEFLGGQSGAGQPLAGVNALTTAAFCPQSKQPELKHAAVKILKAELPWSLVAMAWLPEDDFWAARAAMREILDRFPFASCVPFGRERSGLLLRAAAHEPCGGDVLARIEELLRLGGAEVLRYADAKRGQRRAMKLDSAGHERRLQGFLLAGDTRAQAWIRPLLLQELPAQAYGRQLLLADVTPPRPVAETAKQVCSCLGVGDVAIRQFVAACAGSASQRLASVQSALQCGTRCGSCVPELKRIVASLPPATPASP